jgi:hypothetical protein
VSEQSELSIRIVNIHVDVGGLLFARKRGNLPTISSSSYSGLFKR